MIISGICELVQNVDGQIIRFNFFKFIKKFFVTLDELTWLKVYQSLDLLILFLKTILLPTMIYFVYNFDKFHFFLNNLQ